MPHSYSANDIKTLSTAQGIRLRPTMYVGPHFDPSQPSILASEACCHAIDEAIDKTCTRICIETADTQLVISYDAGMPIGECRSDERTKAEAMFTQLSTCSNLKKHLRVGEEYCKVGLAVVNACCRSCTVASTQDGKHLRLAFQRGEVVERAIQPSTEANHTRITLIPDPEIWTAVNWDKTWIKQQLPTLAGLHIEIS